MWERSVGCVRRNWPFALMAATALAVTACQVVAMVRH